MDINLDKLIEENAGKFQVKRNPLLAIVLIVAGLVLAYIPVATDLPKNVDIVVASVGILIIIFGFCATFICQSNIIYLPTKEKLKKKEFCFDKDFSSDEIEKMMRQKDFDKMQELSSKNPNAQHVVVTYQTPTKSCVICQHFKFVPYQYEPIGNVMIEFA